MAGEMESSKIVRRVARELLPRTKEVATEITEHVLHAVPGLAPGWATDEVQLIQESNEQNCGAFLATLAFGVGSGSIEPPAATRRLVRDLAAAGESPRHVLRGYRVGQERLWRIWSDHVHSCVSDTELYEILRASSTHLFDFVDQASQFVVEEYERLVASSPSLSADGPDTREELIRALLGSDPVDLPEIEERLAYALTDIHVALFAAPREESAPTRRELQRVIEAAGVPALVAPGRADTWWAWLSWPSLPPAEFWARIGSLSLAGVVIGAGEPIPGRDGFRRSHMQARLAHTIATLRTHPRPAAVRYRDIEIAALLCGDPEWARRMAAERLGSLAASGDVQERLRETLRVVLRHGHNRAQAAKELNIHHKTVGYRIAQAEKLLDRPLTYDTFDIEIALLIEETLGGL
ncbi:hypothetical protein F8M49_29025 [Rhodococcus zopfii]|uniref:PucR family transcriptional regulator n=1 Tax=Rhodococcus zopfii TaxID=43772 RepID=A0ABU3WWR8_9NOCA|nr:hypothetical protein [Rhodococcus zopfii]